MSLHEHICDNCDHPQASVFCSQCKLYLCGADANECDTHIHEPRVKRSHRRQALDPSQHTKDVLEIYVGANALPHLPTLNHTDPLITLSIGRGVNAGGAMEFEYLDRTELQRDEHNPFFAKVFVLDYRESDDLWLKLDVYDGDLEHHTRAFHFPLEKDLIGSATVRLNDVCIMQNGEQHAGFHPHLERDQNRFFYPLTNNNSKEIQKDLQSQNSTVWIEAHQVSGEEHEQQLKIAPVHKIADGLHQSASATLAIKQAIISRSRQGSRIQSKRGSGSNSKSGGTPNPAQQAAASSNASKRLSVPEEAAEKMLLAAAAKKPNGTADESDDEAEDESLRAAGLVHYLPGEHIFNPAAAGGGNAELVATIKHLMGRVQNLEWSQKAIKSKVTSGSPPPSSSPPPTQESSAASSQVDQAQLSKLAASYESILVSHHQLTLQVNDLRKQVENQSKELKLATAQAAAAQAAGQGLPPVSPRPPTSISKRPYTSASPTSAWF